MYVRRNVVCWRKKQLKRELLEIWGAWTQKYRFASKKRLGSDRQTEVETILKGVAKADRRGQGGRVGKVLPQERRDSEL